MKKTKMELVDIAASVVGGLCIGGTAGIVDRLSGSYANTIVSTPMYVAIMGLYKTEYETKPWLKLEGMGFAAYSAGYGLTRWLL